MKAILYIVAILAIGAGAYFTLNNAEKHRKQLELTKTKDKQITSINAKIKEKDDIEAAKTTERDDNLATKEERNGTFENNKTKFSKIVAQLREIDGPLADAEKKLKEHQTNIANIQKAFDELDVEGEPVTIDNAEQKFKELETKKTGLATKNADLMAAVEKLNGEVESNNDRITDYKNEQVERRANLNGNSVSSLISSVNGDWGFVVIKPHPKAKITEDTNLIVVRGDRHIGRLKDITLEKGRVLANIDYKSLVNGMRIRQGDRVILAKPATR